MSDKPQLTPHDETTEFLLYTTPNGQVKVEVLLNNETLWLTQKRMAELFGVGVPAISKHLKNIFDSQELEPNSVISILETTAEDGKTYQTKYYNLDAVISVGYRINSQQATQFRIWATQRLKEYIIKGFTLDDERLKNGQYFGKDYFQELLERVRSIRASERRIYQKITDIFAECSIDYDPNSETTRQFYAHVQDKFHYAITGYTSAEIVYNKADANKPLMGMKIYKNAPDGRVLKSDTTVGKNYLTEQEIKQLERTISAFFDYTRCLLPAGPFNNTIAYVNGELEVSNNYQFKKDNKKANRKPVNKDLFINQEYEFISGILFSKDLYDPKHFSDHSPKNDFHIYHNPLAQNKCPKNLIASKEEYEIKFKRGFAYINQLIKDKRQ